MTAAAFDLVPYATYGAVATLPVWADALAAEWAAACDGTTVPLDVEPAQWTGAHPPALLWSPSTRRVHLVGQCMLSDVDPVLGGVLVTSTPIDVLDVPAGYAPAVGRTGAAATPDGWVRWIISVPTTGPAKLQILAMPGTFPPVRLGGALKLPSLYLDGITWRVPRSTP